jgi:hypothetical protein
MKSLIDGIVAPKSDNLDRRETSVIRMRPTSIHGAMKSGMIGLMSQSLITTKRNTAREVGTIIMTVQVAITIGPAPIIMGGVHAQARARVGRIGTIDAVIVNTTTAIIEAAEMTMSARVVPENDPGERRQGVVPANDPDVRSQGVVLADDPVEMNPGIAPVRDPEGRNLGKVIPGGVHSPLRIQAGTPNTLIMSNPSGTSTWSTTRGTKHPC